MNKGFSLFEVLVVSSITIFISITLIRSLSSLSRVNLERVANIVAADIRLAQQLTLSSHQFRGSQDPAARIRCGYGISQNAQNISSYVLYAGTPTINPAGLPQPCPADRNFQPIAPQNTPIYKITNLDRRVDFVATPGFNDVFFEPPGPTTYINNSSSASTEKITIKRIGTTGSQCDSGSSNCIYICVYLSGRTEITKNTTCPAI
ncbi:MAG: hypothetical protein A3B86_00065 [Candidatus Yanofskybacteria bacterium RIFCSPHIGHO2_02_FULL_38_22b]|uniref:Type II secretion system protein GspH n=1 Tax=Candidatus Yanofskybacteria bacterium RIFCSPHIGHO2_02_FULL_38_22b TaxID=1802673 RepID=A0A1F8F1H4_9BACT|nr:MAG: hypothetical protein A2816_01005 [Candidatus Yanofskybacteria bacterium RIFCSPHIGHO2_01_FULL_39_44]OGN06991.1 MAG: hypothetical protein A3B86_00065 [Candidatus Yanofskybacteria bacterium RIFCSPHIGHO2_02_FULL_38_22b]